MQLHRLSLEAIGPFATEFTVDFAALGQSGIFLLEGPTGAGKSTIIDAIVFALYGEPAGASSSKERLHSHHADPRTRPWVELIFETAAGIYRVHRTPAYVRPKQRGTGTTPQNATARLVKITSPDDMDGGEVLSTSAQEVGGQMAGIIGLTREQFVQTVVLPQGEFAAFLRATGEERRGVLQSIFRTRLYDDITSRLIDRRRDARNAVRNARAGIDTAMAGFSAVTTVDGDVRTGLDERHDLEALRNLCRTMVDECLAVSTDLNATRTVALGVAEAAAKRLADERDLAGRLRRRAEFLARKQLLADAADVVEVDRTRLDMARRAVGVRTALRGLAEAEAELSRRLEHLAGAKADFGPAAGDASIRNLRDRGEAITSERSSIATLKVKAAKFADREKELSGLDEEIDRLAADIGQLETIALKRPEIRKSLSAELAAAQKAQAGNQLAERALDDARKVLKAAHLVATLLARETMSRARIKALLQKVDTAQREVFSLRQQRLAGMAGELALDLSDGEPCVVCGSSEHPRPAVTSADHPDGEMIAAAERHQAELDDALGTDKVALARLSGDLESAKAQSEGLSEDAAQQAVAEATVRLDTAVVAAKQAERLADEIESFDATAKSEDAAAHESKVAIARLQTEFAALARALRDDRAEVAAVHEGRASGLDDLDADLAAERGRIDRLRAALEAFDAATASCDSRLVESDEALANSHFSTAVEATAAALDKAAMSRLAAELADHDNQVAVITDSLADPTIAALSGNEITAVDDVERSFKEAQDVHDAASTAAHAAADRATATSREFATVEAALAANASIIAASAPVIRMADVADASGAANLRKLTLGSYVLVRRFEEVVKAANSRLGPMSNGRYQLERSDEAEGRGGQKTGLSLRILDRSTGKSREPKTFSGGETFYASLCLALGLADVVMSEAGGTDLGTLFVDEGFGSLDPETLDAVMAELGKLSSGGRVVGIVSHVEELKQRVADRIAVRRNDDGSSRLSVNAGIDAA